MVELLTGYRRVHSLDVEEAREYFAQVVDPLQWDPLPDRSVHGPSVLNAAEMGSIRVCYVAHAVPGVVRSPRSSDPSPLYLRAVLVLAGRVRIRSGHDLSAADRNAAAVFASDVDVHLTSAPQSELMCLRMDRDRMEAQLGKMLGRPPASRLRPYDSLDTSTPAMRSWLSTLRMVCHDLDGPRGLRHPALQHQAEQLLMSQLLIAMPPNDNADLAALAESTPRAVTPRTIRRADQLISDHAREALTVADIAEAVGISVRSLQDGFRRHLDTTPTARILQARLSGVHADLRAADHNRTTVAQLAHDWGFSHLGRFAHTYRQTFNESPSYTLRY